MAGNIVWLASYPKSGNTWFRLLLANWRDNSDQPADINTLLQPGEDMLQREPFDSATLLCAGLLHPDEIDRLRPAVHRMLGAEVHGACYVKVHNAYTTNGAGEALLGRGVARAAIYLVRDPRDVAISFAAHNGLSIDAAIDDLNAPDLALAKSYKRQNRQLLQTLLDWSGHVESWLNQMDIPVHVIRYEDLYADTAAAFGDALKFLGEVPDPSRLQYAVDHSRFSELQRQERERGFREQVSTEAPFFRRGQAGAWRGDLTREQVSRIEDAHSRVMLRFGYLSNIACGFGAG